MTAQVYGIISISSFVLSGMMLLASIFLFYKLKIKAVIGELSGKTAAKQVEEIRRQNRTVKKRASVLMGEGKTNLLGEQTSLFAEETEMLQEETTVLGAVDLSSDVGTTVLNETIVLQSENDEVTTILSQGVQEDEEYMVLDEIMEIHTEEVIKG